MSPDITSIVFILFKFLILFGLGLYIVFAAVILRQEQLMANVLEESFEPILRLASFFHLAAAIGVFALALIIL
ncbi:MAG TPA: DUF5657 family protein [Patescibacteria group bacterium]|nr:DUF5657 family protein [Patescibacteria group bacterium]